MSLFPRLQPSRCFEDRVVGPAVREPLWAVGRGLTAGLAPYRALATLSCLHLTERS